MKPKAVRDLIDFCLYGEHAPWAEVETGLHALSTEFGKVREFNSTVHFVFHVFVCICSRVVLNVGTSHLDRKLAFLDALESQDVVLLILPLFFLFRVQRLATLRARSPSKTDGNLVGSPT